MEWYGMAWHGIAWHGMVSYGTVWYGMEQHGTGRHGMVWHDVRRTEGSTYAARTHLQRLLCHRRGQVPEVQVSRRRITVVHGSGAGSLIRVHLVARPLVHSPLDLLEKRVDLHVRGEGKEQRCVCVCVHCHPIHFGPQSAYTVQISMGAPAGGSHRRTSQHRSFFFLCLLRLHVVLETRTAKQSRKKVWAEMEAVILEFDPRTIFKTDATRTKPSFILR